MTWISYPTGYAGAHFPDGDVRRWAASDAAASRRAERSRISGLRDESLAGEMEDAEDWLRSVAAPGRFTGCASALRMARHEAIVVRGWDALDPRIRWEPRSFAGPVDKAAYQAGLAAVGLAAGWHDSLYPSAAQAEAARRDAAQACGLAGDAIRDLDRARGALAGLLGIPGAPLPGHPQGELAEAALRFTIAGASIRARIPGPPAQGDTPAVAAARRFSTTCSMLAAAVDGHPAGSTDAAEALAKIGTLAEPVKDYASSVRHNLKEPAPETRPTEMLTWRDWDPAAGRELAAAWHALNAWHQAVRSAAKARAGRAATAAQPSPGQLPGFPVANPLAPPGPWAATRQRTSPATASKSLARRRQAPGRRRLPGSGTGLAQATVRIRGAYGVHSSPVRL